MYLDQYRACARSLAAYLASKFKTRLVNDQALNLIAVLALKPSWQDLAMDQEAARRGSLDPSAARLVANAIWDRLHLTADESEVLAALQRGLAVHQLKMMAKGLSAMTAHFGKTIRHAKALELISAVAGARDWREAQALAKDPIRSEDAEVGLKRLSRRLKEKLGLAIIPELLSMLVTDKSVLIYEEPRKITFGEPIHFAFNAPVRDALLIRPDVIIIGEAPPTER